MKVFTQIFIFSFIVLLLSSSCSIQINGSDQGRGKTTKGNGNIIHKELAVADYSSIDLGGVANVSYRQFSGDKPYLQVNVDENIFPLLDIKVQGGSLIIRTQDGQNIKPTEFTIYTNSQELNQAKVSGAGDLYLQGEVNSQNMNIIVSGSGNVATDSLYCEKLDVAVSGAGDVKLAGGGVISYFSISGAGDVKAYDFHVKELNCKVSGAGDMEVSVSEKMEASVSGAGDIKYKGNPSVVNKRVSGAGSISKKD